MYAGMSVLGADHRAGLCSLYARGDKCLRCFAPFSMMSSLYARGDK